jgi:hypothetical protein
MITEQLTYYLAWFRFYWTWYGMLCMLYTTFWKIVVDNASNS